jgi:NAD(P)-dependent dehydrogenase (short-subunit alcohol dehydrogenase family)
MDIHGSVCLVTGANRGLGAAYVRALLDAGAAKVYAAARKPDSIENPGVVGVELDITRSEQIERAAAQCGDVNLLINNAGVMLGARPLDDQAVDAAQVEMQTNYFGTLNMCRAFAPILGKNRGGALVNMLSVVSWFAAPFNGTYCSSKAAEWLLTNAIRVQLREQGTLVIGVHAGFIDTDMARAFTGRAKLSARSVAEQTLAAIVDGREEVLTDDRTRQIKAALPHDLETLYPVS